MKAILFPFLFSLAVAAPAADVERRAAPSVTLPSATVVGSSFGGIDSFKGIPFAQPPTGQLRLKPPQPITSNLGTVVSQDIPKSCPQFLISTGSFPASVIGLLSNTPFFQTITNAGEDCLTINVQRPSGAKKGDKLPVLFWIFGGGFELGSTVMYDGSSIISNSIDKGQPIIFVAVNYRVGGFGFLGGKEILKDGSANLGLLDQRLGLQWVADNIEEFGGDPTKVTIWGESAGSISVLNQLVLYGGDHTYKGKPLFRGAIMNSGTSIPSNPVDSPKAQAVYDQVVKNAGCSGSSSTLNCLRTADYTKLLNAVNSVPGIFDYPSLMLSYFPRPDGTALPDSPDALIQAGRYAKVPFIVGNQEDEGTLFALVQSNLTTTDALVDYFSTLYFNNASRSQVQQLVANYPQDASAGSPYNTGPLYNIYPQYKRLAAILGDLVFILPRRGTLQSVGSTVPTWSYLSSYLYGTPILGTVHGSDILFEFGIVPGFVQNSIQTYYINFVNNLDPNEGSGGAGIINWPQWNAGKQLLNFQALSNRLITDDFRPKAYEFLVANLNSLRV